MGRHIQDFKSFTEVMKQSRALKEEEEKSAKQEEYAQFFKSLLQKYGATSPADLSDEKKKEFFDEINKGWDGSVTKAGEESLKESLNEAEINSDAEFKEYATKVLKQMHGNDYDEAKGNDVIDGLLSKKKGNDYGALIGMLNKG